MVDLRAREPRVLLLAGAAPVVLVVGVLLAQAMQPPGGYEPVRQTVSTLAGRGADERWVMTTTLLALGLIYLVVAAGLRAPRPGRWLLGAGALAVVVVALAPQPAQGSSAVHMTAMAAACVAFSVWPLGLLREPGLARGSVVLVGVVVAAVAWLCAQAWTDGTWVGAAERTVLLLQTVWPIRVALGPHRLGAPARRTVAVAVLPLVAFPAGLVAAQAAQPVADPLTWSLSALASPGATDRWIMTATVLLVGSSYVAVAAGLRGVPTTGRVLLGLGGALLAVGALFPQPAGGTSWVHMTAGALAWTGFAAWPLSLVASRTAGPTVRWGSLVVFAVQVALLAWFVVQLATGGTWYGASERITVAAMGVWPLVVAVHGAARPTRTATASPWRAPTRWAAASALDGRTRSVMRSSPSAGPTRRRAPGRPCARTTRAARARSR